jgi:CRP-like cAMP-binding protein
VHRLIRLNARSLREQLDSATDLGTADLRRRLARYLTLLPTRQGYLSLPLSRSELASCVGSSRQSVSQVLADFRRRGWIEPDGREGWHVPDPAALQRLAQGSRSSAPAGAPATVEGGRRATVEMFRGDGVLGSLDEETLTALADVSRVVEIRPGRRLTVQGAQAEVVWTVLSGQLRRELNGDHDTRLLLDANGPRLIGAHHAFVDEPWFCTTTATTSVRACAIPLDAFRAVAQRNPAVARLVLTHLASEMAELVGATAELACLTPSVRLARHLLAIVDGERRIRLVGNQRDLGDLLAVSRQTVNYLIGNLVDEGILVRVPGRNQFVLTDPDRLAERAAAGSSRLELAGPDSLAAGASDAA